MTTSTEKGTPGAYSYAPGVVDKPIRLRVPSTRKWVGIGASLQITPTPPKLPYTIPEATQSELAELFKAGYTNLIVFTPPTAKNVPPVQKPDTRSVEGSKEDN